MKMRTIGRVAIVAAAFLALLAWSVRRLDAIHLQAASLILVLPVAIMFAATDPSFSYVALWPLLAVTVAFGASLFVPADETGRYRWLRASLYWVAAIAVLGVFGPLMWRALINSASVAAAVPVLVLILFAVLMVTLIDFVKGKPRRDIYRGLE